ncbi:hypothetical protein GON01_09380 [Sphingomonas sp. MAH-20]|uniref:Uncharacterized protein n=1 Tax=Sphingomonas horti TaxID=2682842 RepID=A0A6I4J1J9_9SPHN|nr:MULTISPECIES: hypothetical protein [Sphingomonas]MBA2921079.1 hypothetical protein [Sphingomonas sp. CGMCC 1.13658]MVO78144.1 hypothetical protein [Sphingomonas horti]
MNRAATALEKQNDPSPLEQPCKPGENNRGSDLCAQWKAADAAADSALWTERTFYLAIIGTLIGGLTLAAAFAAAKFARDAAIETRRGASAAEQAIEEARRIGEAQTKAYLSISSLGARWTDGGVVFRTIVQNSGQSPALAAQVMLKIVDGDGVAHRVLPEHDHHIPAQSSTELANCYFLHPTVHEWAGIIVIAKVSYADVFERIDGIEDRFADLTKDWDRSEFTELTKAMHVASLLRARGPEDSDGTADDDTHPREA